MPNLFNTGYDVTQGLPGFIPLASDATGFNAANTASQGSLAQQQAFLSALSGAQPNLFTQQQNLANQLAAQTQGEGPNPAKAHLAQATGQNVQQQAALMASARGAQSNPGLIARQAGIQGANVQQQAVGQSATLGAQQQLAAQQQLSNLNAAQIGQQQTGISQYASQNLAYQQMLQNTLQSQNQQRLQGQAANVGIAESGMNNVSGLIGGGLNALGAGMGLASAAHGGVVQKFDEGGTVDSNPQAIENGTKKDLPKSFLGKAMKGDFTTMAGQGGQNALFQGGSNFLTGLGGLAGKGVSSLMGSGSEAGLYGAGDFATGAGAAAGEGGLGAAAAGGTEVAAAGATAAGAEAGGAGIAELLPFLALASKGGKIAGKAQVKGDSKKNDTVPALLSPGEIVIPRSHVGDPKKIAAFLNGMLGTNFVNQTKAS